MEEVAPTATNDAMLLAPEEIQSIICIITSNKTYFHMSINWFLGKSRAQLLGKDERTGTDKKRERRKKKHLQHKKRVAKESNLKEMEKRGIKPNLNKENAQIELKRLTSSGHQIKEVKIY